MKKIHWMGSSYTDLCRFPEAVLKLAGYQLHLVQSGFDPTETPKKDLDLAKKRFNLR